MPLSYLPGAAPLTRMADGTVKQVSPFTGTQVWTVPGRGHRPLGMRAATPSPLDPERDGRHCALCHHRYLETPPEKARLIREADDGAARPSAETTDPAGLADAVVPGSGPEGHGWRALRHVPAEKLFDQVAEFRRIPNLFEILSYDYWHSNYGYVLDAGREAAKRAYLASEAGRAHVLAIARARQLASGMTP